MAYAAAISMQHRPQDKVDTQAKNYNHESEIQYTLQLCQWLLKPIGVWSLVYNRTSRQEQLLALLLMITCFSCLCFVILPTGHYIFFVEKRAHVKVKLLGPVGFCLSCTIKYCYLTARRSVFEKCIEHVEKDWRSAENVNYRHIMLKYSMFSRKLITVCVVFLYTGGISYHTIMQFLSKERKHFNYTFKPLAYPGCDWFLDTQSSPTYEIVFSLHVIVAMIMHGVTTGAYSLTAIFVTHICGQIQIQITRLGHLVERGADKHVERNSLAVIVRNHVEVLRFSRHVERALREICFLEIVESTLIMCLLEYYCLMEWKNSDTIAIATYITLLTSFTFNIFIYCYIGEILSEQCSEIGAASYEIAWYNMPARRSYDLILLNAISRYPPKLTAGKIIDLSLNTFGTVVKTSVMYLNLLMTLTNS